MDDEDRKEIEEKLQVISTNNHNLIEQSNKQVSVNKHFDDKLSELTKLENRQTLSIMNHIVKVNETSRQQDKLQLRYELDHLEKIVEQVRELLLAARLRTLNRDILTDQEINDFNITLEKMENIELDVAMKDFNIIFIIKVPNMSLDTYKEIVIQPVPNKNNKQIILNNKNYITKDNIIYEKTNKISDLKKKQDNCIQNMFNQNQMQCDYRTNTLTEIVLD